MSRPTRAQVAQVLRDAVEMLLECTQSYLTDAVYFVAEEQGLYDIDPEAVLALAREAKAEGEFFVDLRRNEKALFALFVAEAYERGDL